MTPLQAQETLNEHADAQGACTMSERRQMTEIIPASVQAVLDEHVPVIRRNAKRIIDDAFDIGRRLAEVKGLLGRATFLPWLEREFKWSEDTAERLIALHVLQRRIPEVADVSLPITGLYLLAAPSTPPGMAEAFIAKSKGGERVSVAEIKAATVSARVRKPQLPSHVPTQEARDDDPPPRPRHRPPAEIITPSLSAQLVALAREHLNAIVDLKRKMPQPERACFQQEAMERLGGD